MDKEAMVRNAVELAKKQGVRFGDTSPSFRPENVNQKERFHISILTNTSLNSAGHTSIDEHFKVLDDYDEIKLANYLINVFNGLNIDLKAKNIK